jgi:NDP-sugar pyrophosphorylase family protein
VSLPVAILAGGLGTRLGPLTRRLPKSLIRVAGQPFIFHQLALLRRNGIRDVVLCIGHMGEQIQQVVGNGPSLGMRVRYTSDGSVPLGTGGALKKALSLLGDTFFVLYGDSYLDTDYQVIGNAFEASGKLALMTVLLNRNRWDRSNVMVIDGKIISYNKRFPSPDMQHVDYGLAVLHRCSLDMVPEGRPYDLANIYEDLASRQELAVFEVTQRFYEIGSPRGLQDTESYLNACTSALDT